MADEFKLSLTTGRPASEDDIQELFDETNAGVILTSLDRVPPWSVIHVNDLNNYYAELWLKPMKDNVTKRQRSLLRTWISHLSRDFFLSTTGLLIQRVPLLGVDIPDSQFESQDDRFSSSQIQSSQRSASSQPSSSPSPASTMVDPVLSRLALLATAIDPSKIAATNGKPSQILLHWPTQRGVDTKDYISSVAVETDKQFDQARQRLQRIEAKRKAQAEKIKRPSFKGQGYPTVSAGRERPPQSTGISRPPPSVPAPPQIMSSQQQIPGSSQSQGFGMGMPGFTMSQPTNGVFGNRKFIASKGARKKKKSGFR